MIEQILNPIIKPIKRKIIAPLKRAKTLPKRMLAVLRKWLVSAIFGPLSSLNNYLKIGRYYIAKKLIALLLVITLVIVYFGFISPPSFINKWFGRIPQLEVSAAAASGLTGPATVLDKDGNVLFKGQLENGLYTGVGKLYHANGNVSYQGDFAKGMMTGSGEHFDENGTLLYRGAFEGDKYAGEGTLFFPDKKAQSEDKFVPQYEGQFAGGVYEGAGTSFNADGSLVYTGAFVKGVYSGTGKLYSGDNKLEYEGLFNNGVYEGAGKKFDSNGVLLYEGTFLGGKLTGPGKEYFPSGFVKYDGAFLLGGYQGTGSLYNETGTLVYTGSFANGLRNGSGQAFNAAGGVVYDGKFVNGEYEGVGTLFDMDGAPLYKGFFRAGNLFAEGFMNLSLVKLQETLGAPDAPLPAVEEEAGAEEAAAGDTEAATGSQPDESQTAPADQNSPEATAQPIASPAAGGTSLELTNAASPLASSKPKGEVHTLSEAAENPEIGLDKARATSDSSTDAAPNEDGALAEVDAAAEAILPLTLTFSTAQMSFELEVDPDNPEAFYVRKLTTWNSTVMEQTYSRLLAAKAISSKEKLENGRTNILFKSGNSFLTFLQSKNKPVRLEISYIVPKE